MQSDTPKTTGWQPIETAPKDHELLLGDHVNGAYIGFYYNGKWRDIQLEFTLHPTHWMPLPDPPEDVRGR